MNFEDKMEKIRDYIGNNYRLAGEKFKKAIDEIDKSIASLQKTRESLLKCEDNLRLASGKAEDLTVKKLTRGNETMKKMFDEANKSKKE